MQDEYEDDGISLDTLDNLALVISGYVSMGRIGPTRSEDREVENLLAQLAVVVHRVELEAMKRDES
jgi:hypothetical protein